ncbi:unnamed protein product [Diplocarpon coronariae]
MTSEGTINTCHLIEIEIQRLYKRFGYPLVKHNIDFNHTIYIDIAQFSKRNALYIVNEAIGFRAARPSNFIVYDYSTNFNSAEFRSSLRSIGITLKLVPIKAHHSIGKVKRYHRPLRYAFEIITAKHPRLSDDKRLQMAIKAVNDTAGPNRMIPTLLIFKAYLRLTELNLLNPSVEQRAATIKKAIKEVRKIHATRKVNNALGIRNGPRTTYIHDLRLKDLVLNQTTTEREQNATDIDKEVEPSRLAKPQLNSRKQSLRVEVPFISFRADDKLYVAKSEVFLTEKENRDQELSQKLQAEGKITTPRRPF